jgi:hypothetical protein
MMRALRASRLWQRLFPPAPPRFKSAIAPIRLSDYARLLLRDSLAEIALDRAAHAFAAAVISALEEES